MRFSHVKTGPFKIERVITDNPKYLIVEFDDIDPKTGRKSLRKMAKGGEWPSHLAELLREKTESLINENVIVVTSQTTAPWSTNEWFCDVETTTEYGTKKGFASVLAADGKSDLSENIAISELNFIDFSIVKPSFSNEDEFHVFVQTLQKRFQSSIANDKVRFVDEDITRLRLPDKSRDKGSQGGFRVTAWKALDMDSANYNYFVLLRVDRKTLEKKFPEKAEMLAIVEGVKASYEGHDLQKLVIDAVSGVGNVIDKPLPAPQRTYIDCPFSEKDECKALGGKWDNEKRKWYVPSGISLARFAKWMPKETAYNPPKEEGFFRHMDIPYEGLTDDEKDAW